MQSDDLSQETLTFKATWPFDQLINVRSHDNLKHLYLQFHKTYGQCNLEVADLREEIQLTNA